MIEKFEKGDVVRHIKNQNIKVLVVYSSVYETRGLALTDVDNCCEVGDLYSSMRANNWIKTGEHYDVVQMLKDIQRKE